ncbi:tRNA uridine-5-carboxymethylaminomethyl(34) synthesis GTPase MnmE [uncultured Methylobacterium sp.]|uniref:tRNA uridine-5-carboxymethylaminomethyl(34) synthesis GTPase MnmE n=1 Tax=uncultured Methylobacterium sp. TaxID=157278 RepID=UPI0035CC6C87
MTPDSATIFAPATGFGRSAITVIRISGPDCAAILDDLCGLRPPPRRLSLRALRDPAGEILDRAMVCWMPGPGTFTGEDMAELYLHGGLAVRAGVLASLSARPGCRPAEAGAFSRRAFLNGRIDLTEAEATADLIEAETEAQRRQALRQLEGALGRQVAEWRTRLIDLLAATEAALDFSDEGDVDEAGIDATLFDKSADLRDAIAEALSDGRRGERLRDGFTVVLAGAPNAGKSTLLNLLARRDVAIVSPIPGTTRDAIEVRCDLDGLPVVLIDTAGLRDSVDPIEVEGIRRTRGRMDGADLVLHLKDRTSASGGETISGALEVWSKSDLADAECVAHGVIAISAVTGEGIGHLFDVIREKAAQALGAGDALITRERHREALTRCYGHLDRLIASGPDALPELVAEDLRLAVRALGEVAGQVGIEEMLDRLFAGFCIGK